MPDEDVLMQRDGSPWSPAGIEQEERWADADPLILACRNIQAIIKIRAEFGVSLRDGVELLEWRSQKLRRERPDEFLEF